MKIDRETTPALDRILTTPWSILPDGCSECPFAGEGRDVNEADPDEGALRVQATGGGSLGGEPKVSSEALAGPGASRTRRRTNAI